MIKITLIDGTKMEYNTFDEIVDYDKIIKLRCSSLKLTELPDIVSLMTNL
jgi:Leucine-rich repeat (LRR) protein